MELTLKKPDSLKAAFSIFGCALIGILCFFITQKSVVAAWFVTIQKPFFSPPHWALTSVWIVFYLIMGYALSLVWTKNNRSSKTRKLVTKAMIVFGIQLVLSGLWFVLFFGLCNPFLALIEILLLWLITYETIKIFKSIDKTAAKLLYPYLAWVGFATLLNGSIWWLNC
jgi:tryptophan-rich sensory protein